MLDEPTNHLDMHSCDLLIEALNKYQGSLILVSHDRYFISRTANKIWEIVDHEIKEFKGGYEEWVAWKDRMAKQEKSQEAKSKSPQSKSKAQEAPAEKIQQQPEKAQGSINKEQKKELQKVQKQFQQVESRLANLNSEKLRLEAALVDPQVYSDKTKFLETESAYRKTEQELKTANAEYEKVFEQLMSLESK